MADLHHQSLSDPVPLIEHQWPDKLKPTVTIRCITYNHAPYIDKCIQGFLAQRTTFPVEIIIHDDASNDGTAEIVRGYLERHPRLIRGILQPKNLHSQGIPKDQFIAPLTRGDYIAVCEGDDYWVDPLKLERQVRAMKQNPGCDLCIHKATEFHQDTGEERIIGVCCDSDCVIDVKDIVTKRFGMIPTASALITRRAMRELQDYEASRPWLTVGDIYLFFFGAKRGGAVYINETMSVYRAFAPNSWNDRIRKDPDMLLQHRKARIRSFRELDQLTDGAFRDSLRAANRQLARHILRDGRISYSRRMRFYLRNADLLGWNELVSTFPFFTSVSGLMQSLRRRSKTDET